MKTISYLKTKCFVFSKLPLLFIIALLNEFGIGAQNNKISSTNFVSIVPVMKISNIKSNEENPMKLNVLNVDIKILGQIAVTTLEMTYYNNNNRVMEGEFNFPLGEGQTLTRFALDINGQMREGVVVEREQGRKTFEAIARRKVDPGLLEMTEGNNFRARVNPLPAKGSRKIIIAFEQELTDKGQNYLYMLPLKINEHISKFSVHAEVIKQQVTLDSEKNELTNLKFKHYFDSFIADLSEDNFKPDKQIAFSIPYLKENATSYTEPMENCSDSFYFYINVRPKQFEQVKELPKFITLLWDNSNSAADRDIDKELLVLEGYINKINNLKVELVPFNIALEKSKIFIINNGKWSDLKNTLKNMNYDGGTSISCINFNKYSGNEILLFTDGLSNFGSSSAQFSNTPVIAINSSPVANHSLLSYLAQHTGGKYINLTTLTNKEALTILLESGYHFISATIEHGNISDIYPSMPCQFHNSFSQAGKMKGKTATINLNFGFGNQVIYNEKITISAEKHTGTGILRRVWAEKKLADLNINDEENKDEITRIGMEYGIVTPNTSLIVLETLNDYLQYHIVPPKEMQDGYFRFINEDKKTSDEKIQKHIDYVAGLFDDRIKWWNTDFPLIKEKPRFIIGSIRVSNNTEEFYPKTVLGNVTDERGLALPGAAIRIKGTTEVTMTDIDGKFSIRVENNEAILNISYIGYEPVELAVANINNITVVLRENLSTLNKIVVIGYGTQKRRSLNGSVASLSQGQLSAGENKALNNKLANDKSELSENFSAIQLNAWDPETPYLKVLQYASKGKEYETYLKLKREYGNTPAFYMDVCDFFIKAGIRDTALKVISNLAELKLEDPHILRILGRKLLQLNCTSESVDIFKKVLKMKGEEPQSYRDLGLSYEANGQYQLAINNLYEVVKRVWDSRFPEVELIALEEINNIISNHKSKLNYSFIDKRLIKNLPVDIRIVITWDTDNCDMDLWVTDPANEKCYFQHSTTNAGGIISRDFTGGYGPEEFLLKNATNGEYLVHANYYGTRSQTLLAPVTLHLTFFTHFGDKNQLKQETVIRLENRQDVIDVGKFSFKNSR